MTTNYSLIENNDDLRSAMETLTKVKVLAVDTEFWREKTYFPELALIQIGDSRQNFLIDPLKVDLGLFNDLFSESHCVLFHSGSQDIEILRNYFETFRPIIFDTQIAAMMTNYPHQISLHDLVKDILGIHLDKSQTVSKWLQRPLTDEQLQYACEDVCYLHQLHDQLEKQLRSDNKYDYYIEECRESAVDKDSIIPILDRISSVTNSEYQNAFTEELFRWRENMAKKRNIPRNWILKDNQLLKIVKHENPREWQKVLNEKEFRRYSDIFLELMEKVSHKEKKVHHYSPKVWNSLKILSKDLDNELEKLCKRLKINPILFKTKRSVQKIANDYLLFGIQDAGFSGWRRECSREIVKDCLKRF